MYLKPENLCVQRQDIERRRLLLPAAERRALYLCATPIQEFPSDVVGLFRALLKDLSNLRRTIPATSRALATSSSRGFRILTNCRKIQISTVVCKSSRIATRAVMIVCNDSGLIRSPPVIWLFRGQIIRLALLYT
jgi:hypothetical protein